MNRILQLKRVDCGRKIGDINGKAIVGYPNLVESKSCYQEIEGFASIRCHDMNGNIGFQRSAK